MSEEKVKGRGEGIPSLQDLERLLPEQFAPLVKLFCFPPEIRSKALRVLMIATNGNIPSRQGRLIDLIESEDPVDLVTQGGKKYDDYYEKLAGLLVKANLDEDYNAQEPNKESASFQYQRWIYEMMRPYCQEELTEAILEFQKISKWWEIPQIQETK